MEKPVKNWCSVVGDTPIFGDIVDNELSHYGPRAKWRELIRRDLGLKKATFTGVIDLGYTSDELKTILAGLSTKKIHPLSISGLIEEPTMKLAIQPPHVSSLVPLNSLPFPQYRLAVTVDLQALDATAVIQVIEDGWAAKSLLQGRFSCTAEGCIAKAGFKVKIDPKTCISEIVTAEGRREFLIADAWRAVAATVQKNGSNWLVYYGGALEPDDRAVAEASLVSILVERCFVNRTLIQYDNGMTAMALQLRDAASMAGSENSVLVQSTSAKVAIEIPF